ncbi:hypothetical protein PTI98_002241 [Pleurotus ostreatus]|nr:hypothetical protein PTI98_002241 [Pleurotus ostreatus]
MTLARPPSIMTPSPEPAFVLPNPERSLPGHRSQSFSSTPPGLLCSIDFEASSFHLDSNPSIFGPFTEKRDPRSCDQGDIDSTTVAYPSPLPPTPIRSVVCLYQPSHSTADAAQSALSLDQ